MTITRFDSGPRMSQAVVHGDTIFLAGQVADDLDQDMAGQTRQVLAKIDGLLAKAGSSKSKLVSATIWVTDMSLFKEMNGVWDAWIDPANPPARACVQAALARPEFVVEIMVVAAK